MSTFLNRVYARGLNRYKRAIFNRTYDKFRDYTMISRDAYVSNLLLASRVHHLPGCVVECGVWRGGMSAGIADLLGEDRDYYLFDSFEGLPQAKEIDGASALKWQKNTGSKEYYNNCMAPIEFAEKAMKLAGAKSYQLIKGWFNDTLPGFTPSQPISLLRLDGDWYDSTMTCLDGLFDFVCPGGIVVLDDYYTWDGCSRALHDFLSKKSAIERIESYRGVCFVTKRYQAD